MRSIRERVEADLARGDFAHARSRLNAHLSSKGYNEKLLTWAGQISFDMHDPYQAERYWLVTGAVGEHVEQAIATFARGCGGDPDQMASQLPRSMRLKSLSDYTVDTQRRLESLGLQDKVLFVPPRAPIIQGWPNSLMGKVGLVSLFIGGILLVLFAIGSLLHFALKLARLVWS